MQDQDILNGIFADKCLNLPLKFNTNTTIFYPYYKNKHYYTENEAKDALKSTYGSLDNHSLCRRIVSKA